MEQESEVRYLNRFHKRLFRSRAFELVCKGGRGAGKSYSISDKICLYPLVSERIGNTNPLKAVVIRKTFGSLQSTCIELIRQEAEKFGLPYVYDGQQHQASIGNLRILFRSLNNQEDYQKVKSITDIDIMWIEEATEIRENDYDNIRLCVRGGKGPYSQIILSFNPFPKSSWIYKRFFESGQRDNVELLSYTVDDNPFIEKAYIARLDALKDQNPELYKVNRLGEWGEMEGQIYNWDVQPIPENYNEVFYGLDFGYSIDPAALVKIYRRADEFWIEELVYSTGLTNRDLSRKFLDCGLRSVDKPVIYADSAEPKSIEELCRDGWYVLPCEKGPDYKRFAIDYLKSLKIHVVEGSTNILREKDSYVWKKDKNGNSINQPVEWDDHLMDAILYGINTHCRTHVNPSGSIGPVIYKDNFTF